jgi:hypothetical protein
MFGMRHTTKTNLGIGSRVRVKVGGRVLSGIVIEDRGNLGPSGKRLLRVEVAASDRDVEQFEVPEDAVAAA